MLPVHVKFLEELRGSLERPFMDVSIHAQYFKTVLHISPLHVAVCS